MRTPESEARRIDAAIAKRNEKKFEWWGDLANYKLANPGMEIKSLAQLVKKSVSVVAHAVIHPDFKAMLENQRKLVGELPAAQEALVAMTKGLKFTHSRGQMEDRFRVVIMGALNNNDMKPVWGKEGKIGEEPVISELDKAKLAMEGFKVLNAKASQMIGKQINVDNRKLSVNVTTVEMLPDALQELFKASIMHLPTKKIENSDGSTEFVLDLPEDVNTVQRYDLEEGEEEEE